MHSTCNYLCCMKKLIKSFRMWRYRRLYRKLVFKYLQYQKTSVCATSYADSAFLAITGINYIEDVLLFGRD